MEGKEGQNILGTPYGGRQRDLTKVCMVIREVGAGEFTTTMIKLRGKPGRYWRSWFKVLGCQARIEYPRYLIALSHQSARRQAAIAQSIYLTLKYLP